MQQCGRGQSAQSNHSHVARVMWWSVSGQGHLSFLDWNLHFRLGASKRFIPFGIYSQNSLHQMQESSGEEFMLKLSCMVINI